MEVSWLNQEQIDKLQEAIYDAEFDALKLQQIANDLLILVMGLNARVKTAYEILSTRMTPDASRHATG